MGGDDHANFHHRHELDRTGNPQRQGCPQTRRRGAFGGKKLGIDIKQTYLTNGEFDLVSIMETASGDNIAKFCMAIGALGNVRTRTMRAWPESEYHKLISELP